MNRLLVYPALGLLWLYKFTLSPALGALGVRCRHTPSCSTYSMEAFRKHGFWAGGWMTLARLQRCRPGGTHGVDKVPETLTKPPIWAPWRYGLWRSTFNDETDRE